MTIGRKLLLPMAAVVVLLFVVAVPLGDRHHGLGQHSRLVAGIGQTLFAVSLVGAAALIVLITVALLQFALGRRAVS